MLYSIIKIIFWYFIITDNYEWMNKFKKNKLFHRFVISQAFISELHYPKDLTIDDNYLWKISFAIRQIKGEQLASYVEVTRWDTNYNAQNPNYYAEAMEFNRKYEKFLLSEMEKGYPYNITFQESLNETRYIHKIYDILDDINRPQMYLYQKRMRCIRLKYLLGDEAYEAGFIPPCVPIWYFPYQK